MRIRKYVPHDRNAVEHIHFETPLGQSMKYILQNNRYWKASIKYYLEKEPQSTFVAEEKGKIIGYLAGCLDDKKIKTAEIVNNSSAFIQGSIFGNKKEKLFWRHRFKTAISSLLRNNDFFSLKTPIHAGHLHINLLTQARGKGTGTKLLKRFEAYAKENNITTIHAESFETKINPNTMFWLKNGFTKFSKVQTELWKKQFPKEKIYLVCYVKKL